MPDEPDEIVDLLNEETHATTVSETAEADDLDPNIVEDPRYTGTPDEQPEEEVEQPTDAEPTSDVVAADPEPTEPSSAQRQEPTEPEVPEPIEEEEVPDIDIDEKIREPIEALREEYGDKLADSVGDVFREGLAQLVAQVNQDAAVVRALTKTAAVTAAAGQAREDKANFAEAIKSHPDNEQFAEQAQKVLDEGVIVGEGAAEKAFALCRGLADGGGNPKPRKTRKGALVAASVGGGVKARGDSEEAQFGNLESPEDIEALLDANSGADMLAVFKK